jgi:hypothetical protein
MKVEDIIKQRATDFRDFWNASFDYSGYEIERGYADLVAFNAETCRLVAEAAKEEERERIAKWAEKKIRIHLEIERTHTNYPKDWHEGNRNALYDFQASLAKGLPENKK